MAFEWDEAKRLANIEKHGVDFIVAAFIFEGPVFEAFDTREYGEERLKAIGRDGDDVYIVVYTWREERRRIISAWKAGRNERRQYEALLAGRSEGDEGAR
jgi:uncharacterized DUF497 family protein